MIFALREFGDTFSEVLQHRLDDVIGRLVWLITRCDEHGQRADSWDIVGVVGNLASGGIPAKRQTDADWSTGVREELRDSGSSSLS